MKIFAIYAKVVLIKKPIWLDEFREKYDEPYEFHITLKQPCFIEEGKILDLKQKVSDFFEKLTVPNHQIAIVFEELVIDKDEEGMTIMLKAKDASDLIKIQQDLRSWLRDYKGYVKEKYQGYEEQFVPHITVGRHIPEIEEKAALKYFENSYTCEGIVKDAVLAIVNEVTPEEAKNPLNQMVYSL